MNMMKFLPDLLNSNVIFRLLFAFLLGAFIGIERDVHGRPAGLRTNILVSIGACTFMILSFYAASIVPGIYSGDPTRIAAQIITGIGFIGAGSIIKHGFSIKGLTTAASLWISAAIGMCCGAAYIELGIFTTVLAIITLQVLDVFERIIPRNYYRKLKIITGSDNDFKKILDFLSHKKLKIHNIDHVYDFENSKLTLTFALGMKSRNMAFYNFQNINTGLNSLNIDIYSICWESEK